MSDRIDATDGMIYYIIKKIRPELAKRVAETNLLETIIVGLGGQGMKHAGLMHSFGTHIAAGVAPNRGGSRIYEEIPVYNSVNELLKEHSNIVAASIWRHYSTARDAAHEVIEAGIPLVVLITEGIPLKDVRDVIIAARKYNTVLIGGNTPGLIFPPEKIKIGMLPDIFYPEEIKPGLPGPKGVTIISRSGAILYHMSDAMASAGIAQNAVIGIGGDGAIGSVFTDLVPMAMEYENTDLVIVAGEIGGCQEELLARHIEANPDLYKKPLVALLSGAHAPEGKTMGHAGAIITPNMETGTFLSKKRALESAGVPVVNSQYDLIKTVQEKLGGKKYFQPERYYDRMRKIWEAPPKISGWGTSITKVEPNNLVVRGYPMQELIRHASFIEAVHLIIHGELPDKAQEKTLTELAVEAAKKRVPEVIHSPKENISKTLGKYLLIDEELARFQPIGNLASTEKSVFCLGRTAAFLANIQGNASLITGLSPDEPFSGSLYQMITGSKKVDLSRARMLEAMVVASIDHGVTPPSAQASIIASSVRAAYEVAVAHGVGAITDVHGGAGEKAAIFFLECINRAEKDKTSFEKSTRTVMSEFINSGRRIEGMGHRIHTRDPRRNILWEIADSTGVSGPSTAISKIAGDLLYEVRGIHLPINVDGVIGAIIADMGLDHKLAKALFIYGRIAGLSAHYFEEISTQPQMRRINFAEAVYKGMEERPFPEK